MRIEYKGYTIVQLNDGRFKASDAESFCVYIVSDLEQAIEFIKQVA